MKTTKQLKEEKKQSYLEINQINVNLLKKGYILPNGEVVISINIENNKTEAVTNSGTVYQSICKLIQNEIISYIEIDL